MSYLSVFYKAKLPELLNLYYGVVKKLDCEILLNDSSQRVEAVTLSLVAGPERSVVEQLLGCNCKPINALALALSIIYSTI